MGAETATRSYEVRPASGNKEATSQYQGTKPLNLGGTLLCHLSYSLQKVNFVTIQQRRHLGCHTVSMKTDVTAPSGAAMEHGG